MITHSPVGIAFGDSQIEVIAAEDTLRLFTHKPTNYSPVSPLIVVFHGVLRNADEYRDHARGLGDRLGALIIAPLFDDTRFPLKRYQHGGIFGNDGSVAPRDAWTYSLIPRVVAQVRAVEQKPAMPYYFIGHSAGGQFVERMAAFADTGATRIVAANPGTHVFPTRTLPFPYGFGNLPPALSDDTALRRYLAQPLTIYLGTADDHPDENFDTSPEALQQGDSRYARGQAIFARAQELARENNWALNWRLVTVEGIAHDHQQMFDAPEAARALLGK